MVSLVNSLRQIPPREFPPENFADSPSTQKNDLRLKVRNKRSEYF